LKFILPKVNGISMSIMTTDMFHLS